MTAYMRFRHRKVVDYIFERSLGYVATMRLRPKKPSEWLIVDVAGMKFRACVLSCMKATDENIKMFLPYSGFEATGEWLSEAIKLHKGRRPRYIIFMKLIHDESLQKKRRLSDALPFMCS